MAFVQPQVSYLFIFLDEHIQTTCSNDNSYMQDFIKNQISNTAAESSHEN